MPNAPPGRCSARTSRNGRFSANRHPYLAEPELGWWVADGHEGKGIAHEATVALRDWAWANTGLPTIVSHIHRDNARSIVLAERLGARLDPNAPPSPYADHGVWRHPHPDTP